MTPICPTPIDLNAEAEDSQYPMTLDHDNEDADHNIYDNIKNNTK